MPSEQAVAFLTWLTEGGRARLRFHREGPDQPPQLCLGSVQVTRADLSRIARHWAHMTAEAAGALADRCFEQVRTSDGGEWKPAAPPLEMEAP